MTGPVLENSSADATFAHSASPREAARTVISILYIEASFVLSVLDDRSMWHRRITHRKRWYRAAPPLAPVEPRFVAAERRGNRRTSSANEAKQHLRLGEILAGHAVVVAVKVVGILARTARFHEKVLGC